MNVVQHLSSKSRYDDIGLWTPPNWQRFVDRRSIGHTCCDDLLPHAGERLVAVTTFTITWCGSLSDQWEGVYLAVSAAIVYMASLEEPLLTSTHLEFYRRFIDEAYSIFGVITSLQANVEHFQGWVWIWSFVLWTDTYIFRITPSHSKSSFIKATSSHM